MNLRYINLWIDPESGYDNDYRYVFKLHTRFINHFLSIQIRKQKLATDGTYNMISIAPLPDKLKACRIVPVDALKVDVMFDKNRYDKIKGTESYEYYLELIEEGLKSASKFKDIPLKNLLTLVNDFRKGNYKNEWQHKKKRFTDSDIEVVLLCRFTSFDFSLTAVVNKISTKEKLGEGIVIRTLPDEIYFDKAFRDILLEDGTIIITNACGDPGVLINLEDILDKKFNFKLADYPHDDNDEDAITIHNEVNELLAYDGSGF